MAKNTIGFGVSTHRFSFLVVGKTGRRMEPVLVLVVVCGGSACECPRAPPQRRGPPSL